jgi:hypothetical protein
MTTLGATVAVSPEFVIARMRVSERALLPREIAPTPHHTNVLRVVAILHRLHRDGLVRFHRHTDRWSLTERSVPHETKTAQRASTRSLARGAN